RRDSRIFRKTQPYPRMPDRSGSARKALQALPQPQQQFLQASCGGCFRLQKRSAAGVNAPDHFNQCKYKKRFPGEAPDQVAKRVNRDRRTNGIFGGVENCLAPCGPRITQRKDFDSHIRQNRLPANAHMLRYCFWMRRPAMRGAIICATDISDCIKPMTMPWRWRAARLVIRLVRLGRSTALPNVRKTIATSRNVI